MGFITDLERFFDAYDNESQPYIRLNGKFVIAFLYIIMVPFCWNIIARLEYRTHFLTKIWCGNKYLGCYFLATVIFVASNYREVVWYDAVQVQPRVSFLDADWIRLVALVLAASGAVFVGTAYYRLGIANTYLGDYFGILMDAPVTSFPFNVLSDPMYDGASMIFVAQALWERSIAGLFLAFHLFFVYKIATVFFEGPFTSFIYEENAKNMKKKN